MCPVAGISWWEMTAWIMGGGQNLPPFLDQCVACGRVSGASGAAVGLPEPWGPQHLAAAPPLPSASGLSLCFPPHVLAAPGPYDSPPVSRLQLPLRSVREASWLTTQV